VQSECIGLREKETSVQRVTILILTMTIGMSACAYSKAKFLEYQKEVARQAAEPKTPEERCQRRGGVIRGEQCYTPSTAKLDENSCRLRGGLYLDAQCLVIEQDRGAAVTVQQ
jgi:hypothetical protein